MDSSGAIGLDESPSPPPPSPLPSPRSRRLFFSPPEEPEESLLPPAEETPAGAGDGSASEDETTAGELSGGWSDDDPTSSAASSPERPAQLLSKGQMRKTGRAAVKIGTGMAHTVAAKTDAQRQVGLYLADDEDAANIADPLTDIAYRRGDVVGGKLSPDANDFLRSLMGVAGYLAKQVQKVAVVRQIEAGQQAGEVQTLPTEGAA